MAVGSLKWVSVQWRMLYYTPNTIRGGERMKSYGCIYIHLLTNASLTKTQFDLHMLKLAKITAIFWCEIMNHFTCLPNFLEHLYSHYGGTFGI